MTEEDNGVAGGPDSRGTLLRGCLFGGLLQFAAALGTFCIAIRGVLSSPSSISLVWLLLLWLGILPFFEANRRKRKTQTAKGLLIAGGVGVLLSSACAYSLKIP